MQAVILAAGLGLRLRPFTETHPKGLVDIAGKPLLRYTLESLPDEVTEIIFIIGYQGDQIRERFGDHWQNKPIRYVEQTELKGTGDALSCARALLKDKFLAINGDDLYDKNDLTELVQHDLAILVRQGNEPSEYGLREKDGFLENFDSSSSLINCGAYSLNREFFTVPLIAIPVRNATEYSLPHTLVSLAQKHPVALVKAHFWLPVGTPEQLEAANDHFKNRP